MRIHADLPLRALFADEGAPVRGVGSAQAAGDRRWRGG